MEEIRKKHTHSKAKITSNNSKEQVPRCITNTTEISEGSFDKIYPEGIFVCHESTFVLPVIGADSFHAGDKSLQMSLASSLRPESDCLVPTSRLGLRSNHGKKQQQ